MRSEPGSSVTGASKRTSVGPDMIETLIVADDLSGAADTASPWVGVGAKTVVLIDPDGAPGDATVVAVDVNSRTMTLSMAGRAVAGAVKRRCSQHTRIVYHKVDSTLRGNWAVEVPHLRQGYRNVLGAAPLAIVAPAFPAAGRTTVHGRALLDGTPLEEAEVWKSEGLAGAADIRSRLAENGLVVELASLEQVRTGVDRLRSHLAGWAQAGVEAAVCDAEFQADLDVVAAASLSLPHPCMWVGSAGLMRALVQAHGWREKSAAPPQSPGVTRPVLVIVGSASRVSQQQFKALAREQGIIALRIPPAVLCEAPSAPAMHAFGDALDAALGSGSDVAVTIEAGAEVHLPEGCRLVGSLAALVAPRLRRAGGLVVTGGETARDILVRSRVFGLRMQGEIEPGVPLGMAMGDIAIPVVTKAGAFGSITTLIDCRAALRKTSSPKPA